MVPASAAASLLKKNLPHKTSERLAERLFVAPG
jgi:hypothetical protein